MESNPLGQESFSDRQLPEPHFDEEATLLSARRVVPLHDVEVQKKFRTHLIYALTVAGAVMVGALAATFVYKHGAARPETAIPSTESQASGQEGSKAQLISGSGGGLSTAEQPASSGPGSPKQPAAQEWHNDGATQGGQLTPTSQSAGPETDNEVEAIDQTREIRHARETRRLRRNIARATKKDASDRNAQSPSDLLRIREIFEGTPRP